MLNFNAEQGVRLVGRRTWKPGGEVETASRTAAPVPMPNAPSLSSSPSVDIFSVQARTGTIDAPRLDTADLIRNQRSLERHITDDHYTRSFSGNQLALEGTATRAVVGARWPVIVLPDAVTSSAIASFLRPSEWVLGKLKIHILYSSPVASALTNFYIALQISAVTAGEVTTATTLLVNSLSRLSGPAVINTLIRTADVWTTGNVDRGDELLEVRCARLGGDALDTNVNDDFHLYAIRVEHVSSVREAT